MKKIILLSFIISCFVSACTYEKGEVALPVNIKDCLQDSTIDIINVTIADYSYSPSNITIAVGDTVKWTNTGPSPHTVTCDGTNGTSFPSGAQIFDSGIGTPINVGTSYKVSISVPGNYTYTCLYHNTQMSGTIIVKPRCK